MECIIPHATARDVDDEKGRCDKTGWFPKPDRPRVTVKYSRPCVSLEWQFCVKGVTRQHDSPRQIDPGVRTFWRCYTGPVNCHWLLHDNSQWFLWLVTYDSCQRRWLSCQLGGHLQDAPWIANPMWATSKLFTFIFLFSPYIKQLSKRLKAMCQILELDHRSGVNAVCFSQDVYNAVARTQINFHCEWNSCHYRWVKINPQQATVKQQNYHSEVKFSTKLRHCLFTIRFILKKKEETKKRDMRLMEIAWSHTSIEKQPGILVSAGIMHANMMHLADMECDVCSHCVIQV